MFLNDWKDSGLEGMKADFGIDDGNELERRYACQGNGGVKQVRACVCLTLELTCRQRREGETNE